MDTLSYKPTNESGIMAILNANMVTDDKTKETIVTMGLSACQVRCISHQCNGHYHSKH